MPGYCFEFGHHAVVVDIVLESSAASPLHQVYVDGILVAQTRPTAPATFNDTSSSLEHLEHQFTLADIGMVTLVYDIQPANGDMQYRLWAEQTELAAGSAQLIANVHELAVAKQDPPGNIIQGAPKSGLVAIGLIAFKLLKTIKVVKVALVAASVAVYSVMFTVEFALALIGILVFHEYGHLRAMQKFGIPTKGMYLIPFVGGIALGEKPTSQWQDVYISLMGPVYGLAMTVVFYGVYLATDSHFAGLVASTSALVNLFNLIPVYPLDGGRVVKALVFSRRNYLGLVSLLVVSALCFVAAWKLGFYFITFFIVLGVLDIIAGWRVPLQQDLVPLKPYGIVFCAVWYLAVAGAFIAMMMLIAADKLPGSEIAIKVLSS